MRFPFDPLRDVPVVIACIVCDCDSADSYEEAIKVGWTHTRDAPGALTAHFQRDCHEHRPGELGGERR